MVKKDTRVDLEERIRELENQLDRMEPDQQRLEHLNLALRAIRKVSQILIKEKDRQKLMQGVVDNLIESRGYYNAWIAALDDSESEILTAEAGLGHEFQPMLTRLESGVFTRCGRKALCRSEVIITEDPFHDCSDCPLSDNYAGRGAMTVRLENEGRVYGLLSVSIPKQYLSDEEERSILKEIADDIAFGLRNIEIEKDRRRAEEALEASEKRFRTLIENALIGISIIQGDRVIYQNPEQEKLLGPLPRPAKFSDLESIHPEDMDKVRQFHQDITSGPYYALDTDFRFYVPDPHEDQNQVKWVYCRALRIDYQDRESLLVNLMDITRIKEMEHMLRMQDKMASLGRVAAGIAHEIRNPLSGINVYLNTLNKTYDKADQLDRVGEIIAQMEGASHKIESVIRRVMDFARPGEPKTDHIDINQPIDEAVKLSSVTLRKKGIQIEKNLQQGLPICKADPNLIEEVILNLITNAADAMKDTEGTKKLGISTHVEGNYIVIKVSDSGQGVPNHMRNQIFDPFYTTKNGSTGLGLSLAHRIITDHRGFLRLAKSPWGGAEFIIEIPIEKEE